MKNLSARVRLAFLSSVLAFALSGCGLIQGMQEPPEEEEPGENQSEENACGGDGELTFEGEAADRGDRCGPCDRDTLQCDESDEEGNTLVCEPGATPCRGPENVRATTDLVEEVVVSWDHVDGADEYVIYRDGTEIGTESADGQAPGDELSFIDDEASPATPLMPDNVEASRGDETDGIELTWEFDEDTMLPDGEEHTYEVVAVYDEFEDGDSDPVPATGHTADDFADEFQYRRDGGEWISVSNPTSVDDRREVFDAIDEDGGPNLPDVDAGTIEAGEGEPGFDVALQLSDFLAHPVETVYEVRAVTESGTAGAAAQTTGSVGVEQFSLEFQRADDDDADDEDFTELEDFDVDAVFDPEEEYFHPLDAVEFVDTPPSGLDHHYRAAVSTDGYDANEAYTDTDRGFRGDPALMTGSRDRTLRRVYPNGEEGWKFEDFFASVTHIAVDPDGDTYAQGGDLTQGYTVRKIDPQGQQLWSFDDAPIDAAGNVARATGIAVDADGQVFATYKSTASLDSKLFKLNSDGEEVGHWALPDGELTSVAVDADGYVYVTSTDGSVRKFTHYDDDEQGPVFEQLWMEGDDSAEASAVAVDSEGAVYWGSVSSSNNIRRVQRLTFDDDDDPTSATMDTVDILPNPDFSSTEILDLVVVPDGRVYVATSTFLSATFADHGALLRVDFDSGQPEVIIALDPDEPSPFTSVDVDLEGHLYYADSWFETIYKLDSEDDYDEIWRFEGHVTSAPDDPFVGDCDTFSCVIHDIAVGPGHYGAFPDAWDDFPLSIGD